MKRNTKYNLGRLVLLLVFAMLKHSLVSAQTPLPNPDLVQKCPYDIIFVLDESGSIVGSSNGTSSIHSQLRNGARDLISSLSGTGSRVAVVEFNSNARRAVIGGLTTYQTINSNYVTAFNNYVNSDNNNNPSANNYDPEDCNQCYTNWEDAFNQVQVINTSEGLADLVIFFTDGMPTAYINTNGNVTSGMNNNIVQQALLDAIGAANAVKVQGSHIFVVGIPNPNLPESNVQAISGPDKYPVPEPDFPEGDYSVSTSATLQQDLSRIAYSFCRVDLRLTKTANKEAACDAEEVVFTLTLYNDGPDNGTGIVVQDLIPSGYTYSSNNGGTTVGESGGVVTWTAGDLNAGNSATVQITVTTNASGNNKNTAQVTVCPQTDIDSSPNNDDGDQSEDDEAFAIISVSSTQTCNDGNPCSVDECYNGQCQHTFFSCNDGEVCTVDECINDTCQHTLTSYNITVQTTICDNEFYFAGGALQNSSGTYVDSLLAASGCDSIRTTILTVLPTKRNIVRIPICQGDSLYLGGYYRTQSGAYNDSFIASNGCDSIFTTVVVIPNCSDNSTCTDDFCIQGICTNLLNCDDNNTCTLDSCISGTCANINTGCDAILSGHILSELGVGIPNTTVQLTGSISLTTITGNDGYYEFHVLHGGNYTITPSKNNEVNPANGVTTLDMALMIQHILFVQLLSSPYKIIAADVNESNAVTSVDLGIMRGLVLGSTSSFPGGVMWKFVNSDYVFPDPIHPFPFDQSRSYFSITQSYSQQNFIGVKLGDVNNSWDPTIP